MNDACRDFSICGVPVLKTRVRDLDGYGITPRKGNNPKTGHVEKWGLSSAVTGRRILPLDGRGVGTVWPGEN
jgi:hypothetical protein